MTKFVIELDAMDTYRVLCLLYCRAAFHDGEYFLNIIEQIEAAIDAQTTGKFFQCSACTDQVTDHETFTE